MKKSEIKNTLQFIVILFLPLASSFSALYAQSTDTLRISDAIKIGLENNFSLRIARNEKLVARNNNTLGAAGFLPKVDISSSASETNYDIRQELATGNVNEFNNYPTKSTYGGVQLSWTLFDGFAMFANRQRLSTLE